MVDSSASYIPFFAGALTGGVGVTLSFPFESYRLRILFENNLKTSLPLPKGTLYRGISSALVQSMALRGVTFFAYEKTLSVCRLSTEAKDHASANSIFNYFLAGAASSVSVSWVREPFGVFRSRTQAGTTNEKSFVSFVCNHLRSWQGFRLIYAGYFSSAVTSIINRGIYFSVYELIQRHTDDEDVANINPDTRTYPMHIKVIAASMAGCLSSLSVYPFDVVCTFNNSILLYYFPSHSVRQVVKYSSNNDLSLFCSWPVHHGRFIGASSYAGHGPCSTQVFLL